MQGTHKLYMAGGGFSGLTSQTLCSLSCGSDTIFSRNPARPHTSDRWQQRKIVQMDTDDLSIESYEGILIEAEKLTHDLTLHFGVLSGDCKNETEYIDKADKLTRGIMQADNYELDDLLGKSTRQRETGFHSSENYR